MNLENVVYTQNKRKVEIIRKALKQLPKTFLSDFPTNKILASMYINSAIGLSLTTEKANFLGIPSKFHYTHSLNAGIFNFEYKNQPYYLIIHPKKS